MQLTITSVMSMVLFSLCFAFLLEVVLRNDKLLGRIKYELLLVCMAVPIIKILIPMEILPWTKNVAVTHVLPDVVRLVNKEITVVAEKKITCWNLVLAIMLTGALLKMIVELCLYVRFKRWMTTMPEINDTRISALVESILKEQGKNTSIVLKWTKADESPRIGGFLKPYILIPLTEYSETELECILRHEIAHWVYGDMVIRLGWIIIKIICWWNPAVYILDRQFEKLLEIRADENAVKKVSNAVGCDYMETLVKAARNMTTTGKGTNYCASFKEEKGIPVKRRVQLMLARENISRHSVWASNIIGAVCLMALTVAMNVFIFEPKGEIPEENVVKTQEATTDNSFLIKNADGTYDMYYDGKYRLTVDDDMGSNMKIYNSLEEALQYEEIE